MANALSLSVCTVTLWTLCTASAFVVYVDPRSYVDPRDVVRSGIHIAGGFNASEYYNQPQAIQLNNGSWLLLLTNAAHTEGQTNQRVVSRLHPSPYLSVSDSVGWLPDVNIEHHAYGPSAGWVVPLYAPALDRVYAIYTFNADNITHMPDGSICRCQLVGGLYMRWSNNLGASWSAKRLKVAYPYLTNPNPQGHIALPSLEGKTE